MAKRWTSKVILAEIEGTYGTDPTPTGADNAMLMVDVSFSPMEGEDVSRNLQRPFMGAQAMIPTGLRATLTGKVELAPSGTAGTAPKWGPLLRACGCAETIEGGVSVSYSPVSDAFASVTIHFYMDGVRQILTGCRGNAVLRFTAQQIPYLEFTLTGLWSQPTDTANAVPVFTGFMKPQIVNNANTPTATINSVDMVLREASLNLGCTVEPRLLVNSEAIIIAARQPSFAARVEATAMSVFNPFSLANAQTAVAAQIVHGSGAGNIATLTLPTCQLKRLSGYESAQNIAEWPLELMPLPADGNDEWVLGLT
jgi:hypothetical protein